jgi:hypothetical protein
MQDENDLLKATSEAIMQLARDRDDILAGFTAVLLDLYRVQFQEGHQTKPEALLRLQIERDFLARHSPHQKGVKFLDAMLKSVETLHLQPAKPLENRQLRLSRSAAAP